MPQYTKRADQAQNFIPHMDFFKTALQSQELIQKMDINLRPSKRMLQYIQTQIMSNNLPFHILIRREYYAYIIDLDSVADQTRPPFCSVKE